jgi:DNA-binding winged helix-turn-helix (wHTH) protein/tetratricopeptide (TPR) repeat protein
VADTQELLRFGTFELNLTAEELRKSGTLIKLSPQPFKLLAMLARRSGQVVSREEIQQTLWGEETYVDFEQGMNHCVKQIRNALSDSADTPLYVETVPRRGYRFLAPVVTKTILAPAPRVIESQSGIQSRVPLPQVPAAPQPAQTTPVADATPTPVPEVKPAPPVPVAPEPVTPQPVVPQVGPVPTPHPDSASVSRGSRLIFLAIAVGILIAAVAGILYWHSRQTVVLSEKDTLVLTEFDNTTGEAVFDNALKQALSLDLEQSPFLNVLSDEKVTEQLRFMGLPPDTRLSGNVARQVCQRSGSKAMIVGSISGIGGSYEVGLHAIDCASGDTLASAQAEAGSRKQVLSALGKATSQMRAKLGESLASVQKYDLPVEQVTTSSLDALKAYSLGVKMHNTQGYAAAIPYFKSAIDLDPNFAMAYARLGTEYENINQPTLAAENVTKAYQLRDRTSEREKLYITSHYYDLVDGNAEQAIDAYQLLQQDYPHEESSYMNLNYWYNATGKYDEALEQAKKALQLNPGSTVDYHNVALTYVDLDRLNDAQAVLGEAEAKKLVNPLFLADLYEVAFLHSDTAGMARQVAAASGKPGIEDQMLALQADTDAYYGQLQKARELSQSAHDSANAGGAPETATLWQLLGALHQAELGDPQLARKQVAAALATSSGKTAQILAALVLARSGDRKPAESLADELVKKYPDDTLINDYWVPSVRAAVALDEKNPSAAIDALRPAAPYETGAPSPGVTFYPVYLRGLAYLQQGQGEQAAAEFNKMLKYPGVILNLSIASLVHLQLARAEAMSGNREAARKSYEEFLQLWKDADADLALLKQAQAEYAKLR